MERNAATIRKIIVPLDDRFARVRVDGDDFSVVEHLCHLRDHERDGLFAFAGCSETHASYMTQNVRAALADFLYSREQNAFIVRNADDDMAARIEYYVDRVLDHDAAHITRLLQLRDSLKRYRA